MRTIPASQIVEKVRDLCIRASFDLPPDVSSALQKAIDTEESPRARCILEQCVENANIAHTRKVSICQDSGFAVIFIQRGTNVLVDKGTITEAVNEGVRQGYNDGFLRKSIVNDPLFERKNTGDNTPAIVHIEEVPGDLLNIIVMPKGGGSENMSALCMLKPSDGQAGVIDFVSRTVINAGGNPCPPVIVGVGIGGTSDYAMLLSKKALLRPLGVVHSDARYQELEIQILNKINASGVGPQGLGGTSTAFAVHIECHPCHIASMPVAVSLNCHAARKMETII